MLKRFNISIPTSYEEQLLGLAEKLGVNVFSSPVIRDSKKDEIDFEYTGETIVSFIVSSAEQNPQQIQLELSLWLKDNLLPENIEIEEYSDNQDWMAGFREYFRPILVGNTIVIRPPWAKKLSAEANATTLLIEPGMAFGTGTHETTRVCLKLLEKKSIVGQYFLDLGAGSGILSFYLMKRGAKGGVAIEKEGAAVENMRKNAALNGMSDRLKIICADIGKYQPKCPVDGIVANITSSVILEFLPVFSSWVKKGGWGVFSGVNSTNAPVVEKAFIEHAWICHDMIVEGDWHGFALIKS